MEIEEASGAQLSRKKEKEYSVVYNFSHSSCQVLLLCVVVASNLFASTKIYLLLNQNCKEKAKRKKSPHHFPGWRFSTGIGMANLGFGWWLNLLSHSFRNPFFFCCASSLFGNPNQTMSDRYRNARCLTVAATVARILLSTAAFCRAFFKTSFGGHSSYFVLFLFFWLWSLTWQSHPYGNSRGLVWWA